NAAAAQGRGGQGRGGGGGGQGRGGQGRGGDQAQAAQGAPAPRPGLTSATFTGGYTLSFWVADVATGDAQEFWHNQPSERIFNPINQITWHDDRVVFQLEPEEWTRFYSVPVTPVGPAHNTGPNSRTDVFNTSATPAAVPEPT